MLPQTAADHYAQQQDLAALALLEARSLWSEMTDDFDASWDAIVADLTATLTAAQLGAARDAIEYIPAVLAETNQDDLPTADISAQRFAGTTADGRPTSGLLRSAVSTAKSAVGDGATVATALAAGGKWLDMAFLSEIADANRGASAASITVRPTITGWVRMLNPPSCKRCAILAGKWFRWNEGFERHPRCDCRHIPASENVAGDFVTDPYEYFKSLTAKQQDSIFGAEDAQAIRDGGDIFRVVNIRDRGLAVAKGWQARRYGTPTRLTINDIYDKADGSRDKAIELMEREGFITGARNPEGNVKGTDRNSVGGAMGRGGTRIGATTAFQQAQRTGIRDPYSPDPSVSLDPATQTAAERRLHQAYLIKKAVDEGRNPFGSGPLTEAGRQFARVNYEQHTKGLAALPPQHQLRRLARVLGILP